MSPTSYHCSTPRRYATVYATPALAVTVLRVAVDHAVASVAGDQAVVVVRRTRSSLSWVHVACDQAGVGLRRTRSGLSWFTSQVIKLSWLRGARAQACPE